MAKAVWCVRDKKDIWCAVVSGTKPDETDSSVHTACGEAEHLKRGLEMLASTFYKGNQHQDYAKHVLDAAARASLQTGEQKPSLPTAACPDCDGHGIMHGYDADCPTCGGSGKVALINTEVAGNG